MHQHRLVTGGMGGLFPERLDVSQVQHILNIACSPGDWVLDVAYEYPLSEVIGIDLSRTMVEYARAQAGEQGSDNASFCVMDALQLLAFPDDTLIWSMLAFSVASCPLRSGLSSSKKVYVSPAPVA